MKYQTMDVMKKLGFLFLGIGSLIIATQADARTCRAKVLCENGKRISCSATGKSCSEEKSPIEVLCTGFSGRNKTGAWQSWSENCNAN